MRNPDEGKGDMGDALGSGYVRRDDLERHHIEKKNCKSTGSNTP